MRRIGTLESEHLARRFCDYMTTVSIDAVVSEPTEQNGAQWDIWIRDERDVPRAREEFSQYQQSPDQDQYDAKEKAARIRDQRVVENQEKLKQRQKLNRGMPRSRGAGSFAGGLGGGTPARQQNIPVTIAMIVISVVVGFASGFGSPYTPFNPAKLTSEQQVSESLSFVSRIEYAETNDAFASIRRGQIWRLVTPMFLHGSTMHLAFNMLWIFMLGSSIERLHGSLFMGVLLLVTQIAGMMLQVMLPAAETLPPLLVGLGGSPFAIGASGAVYGLFGYLWIRPNLDPGYPIQLVPMNVALMLGWLVLCMTPLVERIANGAHLGGLIAGILVAVVVVKRFQ